MITRRAMMMSGLAALAGPAGANPAAEPAIDGVGKVVVGFGAGSSFDVMGRHFAEKLRGSFASTVIVENRPGAAGRIAIEHIKRAGTDGTSIIFVPSPLLSLYPHLYQKLGYDPLADLQPLGVVYTTKAALMVGRNVPASVKNVQEFAAWARNRGPLNYTANAEGATTHLLALRMNKEMGLKDAAFVAYNASSSAASVPALLAGDLDFAIWNAGTASQAMKTGQARMLGITAPTRSRFFPDVPTFGEQGFPAIADVEWGAFYTARGVPPQVRAKLVAAIKAIAEDRSTEELLGRFTVESTYKSPEEADRMLRSDFARYQATVREAGIKLDR